MDRAFLFNGGHYHEEPWRVHEIRSTDAPLTLCMDSTLYATIVLCGLAEELLIEQDSQNNPATTSFISSSRYRSVDLIGDRY